jgi:antitoxin component YwqK of YwqJK toxin-antitoxin module
LLITFNEKKLKTEENEYKNGVLNGSSKMFFYNQDEKITGIQKSEYKNGIKNGKTELLTIEDGNKERSLSFTNFINGIKDGDFQEIKGDSLIIGTYKNDKLNGKYKVYVDVAHMLIGGIIKTDTSDLIILTDGNYIDGLKSGNWKIYDLTSTLKSAGNYSNNKKTGVWSYYYSKYGSLYDAPEVYSGKLYLTETYENGLKNGESIRYSSLEDIKVLCDTMESRNFNPRDTCYKKVFNKEYQSLYLKNDELHGPCLIKDSTGIITFQGNFILGKKNGEWLESYVNELIDNKPFYIFEKGSYKEGKRIGNWKEFANEDFIWNISNYTDGKLNGKYTSFYKNGNPQEIKQFVNGYLKEVIIYDSIGVSLIRKYDILEETDSYLKIRKTSYEKRFITSYDYWIKNDDDMSNHNFFELMFDVKTSNALKGIHSYYDGEVKITDQNGQIILKGNMHKEDMIGVWEYYYPDQNVQINVIYLENKPALEKYLIMSSKELFNGIFTYLDTEKNIREERKIKNGLKNGTTQFYDENNKKIRSEKYKDGIIQ